MTKKSLDDAILSFLLLLATWPMPDVLSCHCLTEFELLDSQTNDRFWKIFSLHVMTDDNWSFNLDLIGIFQVFNQMFNAESTLTQVLLTFKNGITKLRFLFGDPNH